MTMRDDPWRSLSLSIRRATPLSRHGAAPAFRLDLDDGRTMKGRVFPNARWAAQVHRLLAAPGASALPKPLLRAECVLISEFIEGAPLDEWLAHRSARAVPRLAREAGRLMASVHSGRSPGGAAPTPARYRTRLAAIARRLVTASLLEPEVGARLAELVAPARARGGLTHGDICPENLILTPSGRLKAIDEERLAIRPFAYDLARAINRWPLHGRFERAFLSGYEDGGGDARGFRRWRAFWIPAALATSAEYRLARAPGTLGPILDALRRAVAAGA
jgi:aminoglycoside phosphotransferase (APT) family kinase protein